MLNQFLTELKIPAFSSSDFDRPTNSLTHFTADCPKWCNILLLHYNLHQQHTQMVAEFSYFLWHKSFFY